MKLQPLYDLQQEINRLYIAGSKFAKGDPRLQKHIPVLNKLGEKAPVFKKLATDIEELLNTEPQQSPEKLMAISTLLYSILYTQGESTEGDMEITEQKPNVPIDEVNTEYSYLQLKPVIQALTTSNSGRLEILREAKERNIFNDSRTYQYLDTALGDKYAELCDYVEKTIIPEVGKAMLPFLKQNFSYEDKTENVRRLRLLHQLGYTQIDEMLDTIMTSSLPSLQAEAIMIMCGNPQNEELIIKLADDKNKQVREAAYNALAKLGTQTSLEKLKDIYIKNKNKTNMPLITSALASTKLPFFFQEVFDQVVKSFEEFIALDKNEKDKTLYDAMERFRYNINTMANKGYPVLLKFFGRVLTSKEFNDLVLAKKGTLEGQAGVITYSIANNLKAFSQTQNIEFYETYMNDIPENSWKRSLWGNYFYTVKDCYPPQKNI